MAAIDIVIPLYNKAATVGRSIHSVLGQTFSDWRLIIVDDGSTDGGAEVVQSFRDPRMVLLHQENQGPGAARNTGIKYASAEVIAFLDADDQWYPWHLENAYRAIQTNQVSLVASYFFRWPQQEDTTGYWLRRGVTPGIYRIDASYAPARIETLVFFVHVWASVVRRQKALEYGLFFEERCLNGEDTILFARMLLNEPFMVIGPASVRYNHQDSELAITQERPLNPALVNPELILQYCSESTRPQALAFMDRWALLTAHHKARNGLREDAAYLLAKYPQTRRFRPAYLRCKLEIALSRWMPYWVRFKCVMGRMKAAALRAAYALGLKRHPPKL